MLALWQFWIQHCTEPFVHETPSTLCLKKQHQWLWTSDQKRHRDSFLRATCPTSSQMDFTQALRASMDPNGVGRVRLGTRYNLGPGVGKLNQSASRHQEFFPQNLPLKAISETAKWCLCLLATSKSTVVPASMNCLLHNGSLQLYKKNLNKIRQNNMLYTYYIFVSQKILWKWSQTSADLPLAPLAKKNYCLTICVSFSDKSGTSSHSISYDFYG